MSRHTLAQEIEELDKLAYEHRLREEDRYLGSVFVTGVGQRDIEAKTKAAYERCLRLGMTHEHGL